MSGGPVLGFPLGFRVAADGFAVLEVVPASSIPSGAGSAGQVLQTQQGTPNAALWGAAPTVPLEFFGPTGTVDDSPTLQAAIDATTIGTAYRKGLSILITKPSTFASAIGVRSGASILFGEGDWTIAATWEMNGGNCSIEGAGVGRTRIHQNITPTGSPTEAAFVGQPGVAPSVSTKLAAVNVVGSSSLHLMSTAGLVVGQWITTSDDASGSGFQGGLYRIVSIASPNITVDRPIKYQLGLSDHVDAWPQIVENATVGNLSIDGIGERFFEMSIAANCLVHDVEMRPSAGFDIASILASFDVFGFRNQFVRCSARCAGLVNTAFALETNDSSSIVDCLSEQSASTAFEVFDCATCSVRGCHAYDGGSGLSITADGNVLGSVDCEVNDCAFEGNSNTGLSIVNGSSGTRVSDVDVRFNATNIGLGASDRTLVVNARADHGTVAGVALGPSGTSHWKNIDVSDCGTGFNFSNAAVYTEVTGFTCLGTSVTNAIRFVAGKGRVSGANIAATTAIHICRVDGGEFTLEDAVISGGGGGAIGVFVTAGFATVRDVSFALNAGADECVRAEAGVMVVEDVPSATGAIGALVNGGTIRLGDRCNFDACGTPIATGGGGGFFNRGTFTLNPGGPPTVAFPDLKSTDLVKISLRTLGGTGTGLSPVIAQTPGVGFVPTGPGGDTSIWAYEIS